MTRQYDSNCHYVKKYQIGVVCYGGAVAGTGLRHRNRIRTQREIAEAALHLFETQGYAETTCEDIANAADVSVRTFFRYFATKPDVLFAGRSDETGPLAAISEVHDRPTDEPLIDVVRHALAHPVTALEAQRELVERQFRVLMATAELQDLRRQSFHRFEEPFAQALARRQGRDDDDIAPRLLAAAATSVLRIAIERWVITGSGPGALQPLVDEGLDHLRHGFGEC